MWRTRVIVFLLVSTPLVADEIGVYGGDRQGDRLANLGAEPRTVRDLIWVWGNPEMTKPGEHTSATYADASPVQRARLLGATNIIMAGQGLPNDDTLADRLTRSVLGLKRIAWEITADGKGGPPFVYTKRMAQVRKLVDKYPKIQAVVLDDMSTVGIDRGFHPSTSATFARCCRASTAG